MSTMCPICKGKIYLSKIKVKDGFICSSCDSLIQNHQWDGIENIKRFWNENCLRASQFHKTSVLKGFTTSSVVIDELHKLFYFGVESMDPLKNRYYAFDEISEYNHEKAGGKIVTKTKGGIGRAVVGGVLFGGVGAVVGAATSKKESKVVGGSNVLVITLDTLLGKFNESLSAPPRGLIEFLDKCIDQSQEQFNPLQVSDADEILKFKLLLDQGIITQEEFDLKKKQLLGL